MPVQCPECARFLSGAFVAGLQKGPAPCPKCGTSLGAHQFRGSDEDATVEPGTPLPEASVRPPDLPPDDVRDDVGGDVTESAAEAVPDPLAGWDRPDNVFPLSSARSNGPAAPPAAVVIGIGAAVGGLLGAVIADRGVRGSLLGGSLGAAAGAAAVRSMERKHAIDLVE